MNSSGSISIELPDATVRPWEQLLKDVRELEQQFDTKIAKYMQFVQPTSPGKPPAANADVLRRNSAQLESEINTILGDLEAVIHEMEETVQHQQRGSPRVLERHRGLFNDYSREFQRYKTNVQGAFDRASLVSGANGAGNGDLSDRDRLVSERGQIDQAHLDIDMVLDQAFSVRRDLGEQRSILERTTGSMVDITERVPGINLLLGRIRSRKRKEKVVLAIVIALCITILFFVIC